MRPKTTNSRQTHAFRRESIPAAKLFYDGELGTLTRPSSGWAKGRCPFHASKSGRSFSVNLITGGFHCFGCDAKGGDVIAFMRLRYHLNFKEACQRLGCWGEPDHAQRRVVLPSVLVRFLVCDFVIDGFQYRAEVRDEPRNEMQMLRRFHAEAKDRLHELREGQPETIANEEEITWDIRATSWALIAEDGR
jgi:hypothetical protein